MNLTSLDFQPAKIRSNDPTFQGSLVEMTGLEPVTSALQRRRSPN